MRKTHPQLIQEILSADYQPRGSVMVEIESDELANQIRARAKGLAKVAPSESKELSEAADLLAAEGLVRMSYPDLSQLVGPAVARTAKVV